MILYCYVVACSSECLISHRLFSLGMFSRFLFAMQDARIKNLALVKGDSSNELVEVRSAVLSGKLILNCIDATR